MLSGKRKVAEGNPIVRIDASPLKDIPDYFNHELIQQELLPHISEDNSKICVNLDTLGLLKELEIVALFTIRYITSTPNQNMIYQSTRFNSIKKLAEITIQAEASTIFIKELNLYITNFICESKNYFQQYLVLKFLDVQKFMREVASVMAMESNEAASEKFSIVYNNCFKSYSAINAITMQMVGSIPAKCLNESDQIIAESIHVLPKLYLEIFDEFLTFNNYSIPYLSKFEMDKERKHIATLTGSDAEIAAKTFFTKLLLCQVAIYKVVDDRNNKLISSQPVTQIESHITELLKASPLTESEKADVANKLLHAESVDAILTTLSKLQGNMQTKSILLCGLKFKRISAMLAYAIYGLTNKVAPSLPELTEEQEALSDLECQTINLDNTGVDFVMLGQIPANMQRTSTEPTIKKITPKKALPIEEKMTESKSSQNKKKRLTNTSPSCTSDTSNKEIVFANNLARLELAASEKMTCLQNLGKKFRKLIHRNNEAELANPEPVKTDVTSLGDEIIEAITHLELLIDKIKLCRFETRDLFAKYTYELHTFNKKILALEAILKSLQPKTHSVQLNEKNAFEKKLAHLKLLASEKLIILKGLGKTYRCSIHKNALFQHSARDSVKDGAAIVRQEIGNTIDGLKLLITAIDQCDYEHRAILKKHATDLDDITSKTHTFETKIESLLFTLTKITKESLLLSPLTRSQSAPPKQNTPESKSVDSSSSRLSPISPSAMEKIVIEIPALNSPALKPKMKIEFIKLEPVLESSPAKNTDTTPMMTIDYDELRKNYLADAISYIKGIQLNLDAQAHLENDTSVSITLDTKADKKTEESISTIRYSLLYNLFLCLKSLENSKLFSDLNHPYLTGDLQVIIMQHGPRSTSYAELRRVALEICMVLEKTPHDFKPAYLELRQLFNNTSNGTLTTQEREDDLASHITLLKKLINFLSSNTSAETIHNNHPLALQATQMVTALIGEIGLDYTAATLSTRHLIEYAIECARNPLVSDVHAFEDPLSMAKTLRKILFRNHQISYAPNFFGHMKIIFPALIDTPLSGHAISNKGP